MAEREKANGQPSCHKRKQGGGRRQKTQAADGIRCHLEGGWQYGKVSRQKQSGKRASTNRLLLAVGGIYLTDFCSSLLSFCIFLFLIVHKQEGNKQQSSKASGWRTRRKIKRDGRRGRREGSGGKVKYDAQQRGRAAPR